MSLLYTLTLLVSAAAAEETPPPADTDTQAIRERMRLLEKAVDELRGTSDAAPTEIPLDLETRLRVYGALNLNRLHEQPRVGFNIDEVVFQYAANLDRKMTANVEVSFEPEEHAVAVGIEAMELVVSPSQAFQLSGGQFHLPLSPWAVTASQGAFRYLPVAVPHVIGEEAGEEFLPVDQVGLQVHGTVPVGFWQIGYAVAATNGRAPDPGSVAQQLDFNDFKALIGRVSVQAPSGISLGGGAYYDLVDVHDESLLQGGETFEEEVEAKTVIDDAGELFVGGSLGWQGGPVELGVEGYLAQHTVEGASYSSTSGFVLLGVPVDRTTPYTMVEWFVIDPDDPVYAVFDTVESEVEAHVGVRYDLGLRLAVKAQLEIGHELESQETGVGGTLQLAAGF